MKTKRFTKGHQFLDWYMRAPTEEQDNTKVIFDYHSDPLIPEPEPYKLPDQPPNRYPLTAPQIGLIILTFAVLGFASGIGLAVTVHFLTIN